MPSWPSHMHLKVVLPQIVNTIVLYNSLRFHYFICIAYLSLFWLLGYLDYYKPRIFKNDYDHDIDAVILGMPSCIRRETHWHHSYSPIISFPTCPVRRLSTSSSLAFRISPTWSKYTFSSSGQGHAPQNQLLET